MKIIYLTGHRKSGTTLLNNLFDNHPDLNVYPVDLSLYYAFLQCNKCGFEIQDEKRIVKVIRESTRCLNGLSFNNTVFDSVTFSEFFLDCSDSNDLNTLHGLARSMGKAWVAYNSLDPSLPFVVKETSVSMFAPPLMTSNEAIQFLHMVRDPRDNFASIFEGVDSYYSKFGEDNLKSLGSFINRARLDLLLAWQLSKHYPTQFNAIKYEQLIASPQSVLSAVFDHLDVPFHPNLLIPSVGGVATNGNNHSGVCHDGISLVNLSRWKERLPADIVGVIEYWLESEMSLWNYSVTQRLDDRIEAFKDFYAKYNCTFFYSDPFKP